MNQSGQTTSTYPGAVHPDFRLARVPSREDGVLFALCARSRELILKIFTKSAVNQSGKAMSADPDALHIVPEWHEVVSIFSGSALEAAD